MDHEFRILPDQASSVASQVDSLYFFLLGVTAFFTVAIFLAIVFLAIYYRRSANRHSAQSHSGKTWLLEVTWIVIPLGLTMVMFVWGAKLYLEMQTPPDDAIELQVVGKQWMWKIQHPQGRSEINELHIPVGRPVRLRMISEDVIHSFFIPAFRVKQDTVPGMTIQTWFTPTREGEFEIACAELCGVGHYAMRGKVQVQSQQAFDAWLSQQKPSLKQGE